MTPYHLHAVAAAWSLQAARGRLAHLATAEHRQVVDALLAAATVLRSPAYGTRTSVGGHGDPTGGAVITVEDDDVTWAELLHRLDGRLTWLADMSRAPAGADPLTRLITRLPHVTPDGAASLAKHLGDEDTWVRAAVRLAPAREALPGVPCPHCGERQLVVQTAGPVSAWTVVCATGRICVGQGCRCGMPGAVEGAAHIWPRTVVLGAVAGAAPGPTT